MKADHSNQLKAITTDVLVVGYGPVGAAMSCYLGRYGVKTVVIDKSDDILMMPRAIALDNEALRILQNAGLDENAFEKHTIREVVMKSPLAGTFGRGNTAGSIDGHPKLVTFYQPELEGALRKQVSRLKNVNPKTGVALVSFEENSEGIQAVIEHKDGRQQIVKARYLVGADGAASPVRETLGLKFDGDTYTEDWLIVDAINRDTSKMDYVEFVCSPKLPTPHMAAPGGRERWEFMLDKDTTREQALDDTFIHTQLRKWVGDAHVDIERKAVYRFHARCCKRFQKGNVFLIGDAAHITPPFVGQGLVAGLRDAANLSWKLASVIQQGCDPKVLSTYDDERRPHATSMINLARRMGSLIMPRSTARALLIHNAMKAARLIEPVRKHLEELEIKPKNEFERGLFTRAHRTSDSTLKAGALFPQGLARDHEGKIRWSDDCLGDQLTLVGIGVDPTTLLDETGENIMSGLDAHVLSILARKGTVPLKSHQIEDLGNVFLERAGFQPVIALVRPDRIVLGVCSPADVGSLLKKACSMFGLESI